MQVAKDRSGERYNYEVGSGHELARQQLTCSSALSQSTRMASAHGGPLTSLASQGFRRSPAVEAVPLSSVKVRSSAFLDGHSKAAGREVDSSIWSAVVLVPVRRVSSSWTGSCLRNSPAVEAESCIHTSTPCSTRQQLASFAGTTDLEHAFEGEDARSGQAACIVVQTALAELLEPRHHQNAVCACKQGWRIQHVTEVQKLGPCTHRSQDELARIRDGQCDCTLSPSS